MGLPPRTPTILRTELSSSWGPERRVPGVCSRRRSSWFLADGVSEVPRLARGLPCSEVVSGARKLDFLAAGVGIQEFLQDWGPWLGRDDAAEVLVAQIPDAWIREAGTWSTWSWKRRTREPGSGGGGKRSSGERGTRFLDPGGGGPGPLETTAASPRQLSSPPRTAWLSARSAEAATINSSDQARLARAGTHRGLRLAQRPPGS